MWPLAGRERGQGGCCRPGGAEGSADGLEGEDESGEEDEGVVEEK